MKSILLLALLAPPLHAEECDGYARVLEHDGVRVFNRKIDGSSVRELCATARVEATPAEVYALLLDVESYPQRLPPTVLAERLSVGGGETVYYMVIDPGFITRRDYCIASRGGPVGDGYFVSWRPVDCPRRAGRLERMVSNTGSWKVTPLDGGRASAIVYHTHADPGGLLPAWLVNSATSRRVPEIIGSLRKALQTQKVSRR